VFYNIHMTKLNFTYEGRAQQRLDSWLAREIPDKSRSEIKRLITAGQVFVNGNRMTKPAAAVCCGDVVGVEFSEEKGLVPEPQIEFEVLAEEPGFLVVNKPAGLVVHPGSGHSSDTLVNGLLARYPEIKGVGEDPRRPGIVHRLDKETSGVLVIARTQPEFDNLKKQFQDRETEKTYLAVLSGELGKDFGNIEGKMRRSRHVPIKRELVAEGEGKDSRTEFAVLDRKDGKTLVLAKPKTGRTHQLRVHFSSIGHPIVGDKLYGKRSQKTPLQLHAKSLRFRDSCGIWHEYEAKPPESFVWPGVDKF